MVPPGLNEIILKQSLIPKISTNSQPLSGPKCSLLNPVFNPVRWLLVA